MFTPLLFGERLLDIREDILRRFQSDGEADKVVADAAVDELPIGELTMGSGRRMQDAGAAVRDVSELTDKLEITDKVRRLCASPLHAEADHAAESALEVLRGERVVGIILEPTVLDPRNVGVLFQLLRDLESVLAVLLHAKVQGLGAEIREEGVKGRGADADIAHKLHPRLQGVGGSSSLLHVHRAVIALVGGGEVGVAGIPAELEVAAVHDHAAHRHRVTVEVLRGAVHDDVGAVLKRGDEAGRREGIVDREQDAVLLTDRHVAIEVKDHHRGIRDGLAEHHLGPVVDEPFDLGVRHAGLHEAGLDPHLRKGDFQEIKGTAVHGGECDDIVARLRDGQDRGQGRRLSRGGHHRRHAALEKRDLLLKRRHGGIGDPRVDVSVLRDVEKVRQFLRRIVGVSGALIDGEDVRLARLGLVTAV